MPPKRSHSPAESPRTRPLHIVDGDGKLRLEMASESPPIQSALDLISDELAAAVVQERHNPASYLSFMAGDMFQAMILGQYARSTHCVSDTPVLQCEFHGWAEGIDLHWMCHRGGASYLSAVGVHASWPNPACAIVKLTDDNQLSIIPLKIPQEPMFIMDYLDWRCNFLEGSAVVLGEMEPGVLAFFVTDDKWLRVFSYEGDYVRSYEWTPEDGNQRLMRVDYVVDSIGMPLFRLVVLDDRNVHVVWRSAITFERLGTDGVSAKNPGWLSVTENGLMLDDSKTRRDKIWTGSSPDASHLVSSSHRRATLCTTGIDPLTVRVMRRHDQAEYACIYLPCVGVEGNAITTFMRDANSVVVMFSKAITTPGSGWGRFFQVSARIIQ